MAKTKQNKKSLGSKVKGTLQLGGGILIGKASLDSGLPRLLGVRLERHSTSKTNAKSILKNGGYLDPKLSGSKSIRLAEGMESLVGQDFAEKANGYAYITGRHKDAQMRSFDRKGRMRYVKVDDAPIANVLDRKIKSLGYRAQSEIDFDKFPTRDLRIKEAQKNLPKAMLGLKGKTLYIGGTDNYFNKNFVPDIDDPLAMRSTQKIKVFGSRARATVDALKRGGIKGLGANPKRNLAGAVILGIGGTVAAQQVKNGLENIEVKNYFRNGKSVKGYKRKSKKNKTVRK